MSILISGALALGAWMLLRWTMDRQGRPTLGVVSGVPDDAGPDGMAPALIRPCAGIRPWWRSGALYSVSGRVWFETRVFHRQISLDGFRETTSREPTPAEALRWAPDAFRVFSLVSDGREYECAVYVEQASFVSSLFTTNA